MGWVSPAMMISPATDGSSAAIFGATLPPML